MQKKNEMFLNMLSYFEWSVVCSLCVSIFLYVRIKALYKRYEKIPGTPPTFLVGNIFQMLRIYSLSKKREHEAGVYITERILGSAVLYRSGLHCFWFGLTPLVSISKGKIAEIVLNSSIHTDKSYEYGFLEKWLGTGLLTSKGEKWKYRRKLLTPSFHFRILEDFVPVFHQQSMEVVERIRSESHREYLDVAPLIVLCTLDIVCETIMGVSIGAQKGNNLEYVRAIHNLAEFFNQRTISPWLWSDVLFDRTSMGRSFNRDIDILHSFTRKVIRQKKEKLLSNSTEVEERRDEFSLRPRKTFMDLLLEMHVKGQQLSEADIQEEVDTFMFEGHDTTAMGIIFALYCIGLYQDVQERIAEELEEIFGGDMNRPVTHDDAKAMKYLECVLKESQRLFPSVPIIGRKLAEDIHYGGLMIPGHSTVHFNLLGLHRDPDVFPHPEVFDPDRFLPHNCLHRNPYDYVPFSAGPRNCIGQKFAMLEEKTIISNILRHFKVISLDPRDRFHVKVEFTLRPAQEVRLKFLPRERTKG